MAFMKKPVAVLSLVVMVLMTAATPAADAADQSAQRGSTNAERYIRTPADPVRDQTSHEVPRDDGRWYAPECRWVGHRIVMALLRDDVLAADGFQHFYRDFDCPVRYLGRVFGCAVPFAGEAVPLLQQHVALCWQDANYTESARGDVDSTGAAEISSKAPTGKAKVPPPATTGINPPLNETGKSGTTYPKE